MTLLQSKENRRKMRLNILKHRRLLLQHLENIDDTELKSKIILTASDCKVLNITIKEKLKDILVENELQMNTCKEVPKVEEPKIEEPKVEKPIIEEVKIKEEPNVSDLSDCSDDLVSVGSNENWSNNDSYSTFNEINSDSRRRSTRLETIHNVSHRTTKNNPKTDDYVYDLDNIFIADPKDKKLKKNQRKQKSSSSGKHSSDDGSMTETNSGRYRGNIERDLHNAKERACRERIAQMFQELKTYCSYLDSTRRVPSKHSILLAAKKECELMKTQELQYIKQKALWIKANNKLKLKLKSLCSVDPDKNRQ